MRDFGGPRRCGQKCTSDRTVAVRLAGGRWGLCCRCTSLVLLGPVSGIAGLLLSPCRVLHTNEWEGEQALSEVALEDALHCTLVRTNQIDQR